VNGLSAKWVAGGAGPNPSTGTLVGGKDAACQDGEIRGLREAESRKQYCGKNGYKDSLQDDLTAEFSAGKNYTG